MRLRTRTAALAVAGVLTAAGPLPAQTPVAPPPRPTPVLTASYKVQRVTADDAAQAIQQHFFGAIREWTVTADPAANQVVIQGSAATHARVAGFVAGLDNDLPLFRVPMTVVQVPREFLTWTGLAAPGNADAAWVLTAREARLLVASLAFYPEREFLSRPQVWVTDGQTGFARVGQDMPAGPDRSERCVWTGIAARFTPRLSADGKSTLLRVESELTTVGPTAAAKNDDYTFHTQAIQTTVVVPAGGTAVVAVPFTRPDGKPAAMLLLTGVHLVRAAE